MMWSADRSACAAMVSAGFTAAEVGTWGREEVLHLARAGDHPDAQAVLLPDTALHTAAYLTELEAELGKPVLTANQVTVWEGLRLLDRPAFSVQYHPEAAAGPHDARYLFDRFVSLMEGQRA